MRSCVMKKLKRNILLNPGPATTTDTVKYAQVVPDICPREKEFCQIMKYVSSELTRLAADTEEYTTVLFSGSGTSAVESVLSSVANDGVVVIINNGLYGERMCEIAEAYRLDWVEFQSPYDCAVNIKELQEFIINFPRKVSYLAIVHNETTTGLLNDIEKIGEICRRQNIQMIVDAMSSFAAIPIQMKKMNISYLAASSNKNLQGMAGISFVIAKKIDLQKQKELQPANYYLNLYAQYQYFIEKGQMRFTPPVQTICALKQAIIELKKEGIKERYKRYSELWEMLVEGLSRLGLKHLISKENHSKLITAIIEPDCAAYDFNHMHDYFYANGITIYPGKLTHLKYFRIANIGDLNPDDMDLFLTLLEKYLQKIDYCSRERYDEECQHGTNGINI